MAQNTHYQGQCACGEIKYDMAASPLFVHACHCTDCQRLTGTSYALNALIEYKYINILRGNPKVTLVDTPSGSGQEILRCPTCNVALWSYYMRRGRDVAFVRVGTLQAGHDISPDVHIHTSAKQPWVTLNGAVPVVLDYYNMRDLWPAESLKRWDAL